MSPLTDEIIVVLVDGILFQAVHLLSNDGCQMERTVAEFGSDNKDSFTVSHCSHRNNQHFLFLGNSLAKHPVSFTFAAPWIHKPALQLRR